MKYERATDGEWLQPIRKGYKLCCCDCGLVHDLDFRVVKRKIQFRAFRNNRSTALVRRHSEKPEERTIRHPEPHQYPAKTDK